MRFDPFLVLTLSCIRCWRAGSGKGRLIPLGIVAILATDVAYTQQSSFSPPSTLPPTADVQLRRQLELLKGQFPAAVSRGEDISEAEVAAALEELRPEWAESTAMIADRSVVAPSGSVTATARCRDGYVVNGSYDTASMNVTIVSKRKVDCDTGECRAFQVAARSEDAEPFELDVWVTCSA